MKRHDVDSACLKSTIWAAYAHLTLLQENQIRKLDRLIAHFTILEQPVCKDALVKILEEIRDDLK